MKRFERVTTEYIDTEDRLRLAATLPGNEVVVAWLTQRLLQRMVPVLVQWLHAQAAPDGAGPKVDAMRAEVMQGFAQQAARAQMTAQPPVLAAAGQAPWLVCSVDVAQHPQALWLTFKGTRSCDEGVVVLGTLTLEPQPLRQWLNILYDNYRRAGWPLQAWPDWVTESAPDGTQAPALVH